MGPMPHLAEFIRSLRFLLLPTRECPLINAPGAHVRSDDSDAASVSISPGQQTETAEQELFV